MKRTPSHAHHDHMREFPRREILQLTVACHQAGLKDIEREWPAHGLWDSQAGRWHWFDIAGTFAKRLHLFDFQPGYIRSSATKPELERQQQKAAWAEANEIPLFFVPHGFSTLEMTILIKQFIMEHL